MPPEDNIAYSGYALGVSSRCNDIEIDTDFPPMEFGMIGIEQAYCDTIISALIRANRALLECTIEEALQHINIWGKGDTLGLDAVPEIAITERLKHFDQYATIVIEEEGEDYNPLGQEGRYSKRGPRTFFVSDPTDRSAFLEKALKEAKNGGDDDSMNTGTKIREVILGEEARRRWEDFAGSPASITGAMCAITCVRRGLPICSGLLNYVTQELIIACSAGIYLLKLPPSDLEPSDSTTVTAEEVTLNHLLAAGQALELRSTYGREPKSLVTFLGKPKYRESFQDSQLVPGEDIDKYVHHSEPGGPGRILYLSELQPESDSIGFILANGEKISEWIHWLTFARFARQSRDRSEPAVRVFEVSHERPWTRDGVLMSTSPEYSIFQQIDAHGRGYEISVERLQAFANPSLYRSTLLVAPSDNDWAVQVVRRHGYRVLEFPSS